MQSHTAKKLLPIISDETKIEVSLEDDRASIELSTWVENLGWCTQKTLKMDVEMLDDLHRAIAAARYKVNKEKSAGGRKNKDSKIIEFPGVL